MENMEKVVKIYKTLSKTPSLIGGRILKNGIIDTQWSQRNVETGKNIKFTRTHFLDKNLKVVAVSPPIDNSNELLSAYSPSEKYKAVLRDASANNNTKDDRKLLLEVWNSENLLQSIDLTALNVHGNVYTNVDFKSFCWSPDETKILYIAEKKLPNREPFYKRKTDKKDDNKEEDKTPPSKGEEYQFRQDWGEQYTGKYSSVIAIYDVEKDDVNILKGIPDNFCPSQVIWSPDGSYIVGIALDVEPRKLGLIYCANRPGFIFRLDLDGNYQTITEGRKTVTTPKFSPDGKYLIWLEKNADGPHQSGFKLMRLQGDGETGDAAIPVVVVDLVDTEIFIENKRPFYGLYSINIPNRCFAADNRRLILSGVHKNSIQTFIIHIENQTVTLLKQDGGSTIVLDVHKDQIVFARKNYLRFDQCVTAMLPSVTVENLDWMEVTKNEKIPLLVEFDYDIIECEHKNNDEIRKSNAIYVGPNSNIIKSVPLIIWPHGGPHSACINTFLLEPSVLLRLGFAILFVNYRGSIGSGEKFVKYLLGRIGKSDVEDCVLAAEKCCEKYKFLNPDRMSLVGGSHGGFLIHHLSGQYPDMFKAVVSRNPVIDIASMSIVSDIPDWCYVEAGSSYSQEGPVDNEILLKMREKSPIQYAHQIKAPTFLMLGSKDLRVPCSQGLELYYRLKSNKVPVQVNMYDDNHILSGVMNEMDDIINGALWLLKYT